MNEFVHGKDVEFIEPVLRSENGQDASFEKLISPCLPPPVLGFHDTNEFYRATIEQTGSGYATGPFSVYRLPTLADSVHQNTVLIRMTRFRFASGILEYFLWTKYARLDLERCDVGQENSSWLFIGGDNTRLDQKAYFADGVVRLGDEYYLFEFNQNIATQPDTYDPSTGAYYVSLWKLQADIRAMSIMGFPAE